MLWIANERGMGVFRTGFVQQEFQSFGCCIKVALFSQQEGFSKTWIGKNSYPVINILTKPWIPNRK